MGELVVGRSQLDKHQRCFGKPRSKERGSLLPN